MGNQINDIKIPTHIGIIMDGNGRWAESRGIPRNSGHKKGAKVFEEIAKYCKKIGVKYLTVYAFSTENWERPQNEIDTIMDLLRQYLKNILSQEKLEGRLKFLGDFTPLDDDLKELIKKAEGKANKDNEFAVNIALNYGGRDEIVHAVKRITQDAMQNKITVDDINEKIISNYLYTENQPTPDLIIRPGGEKRTSNFLLWQSAYSELVFQDVLWPDFTTKDLDDAIATYSQRNRRYGGI